MLTKAVKHGAKNLAHQARRLRSASRRGPTQAVLALVDEDADHRASHTAPPLTALWITLWIKSVNSP